MTPVHGAFPSTSLPVPSQVLPSVRTSPSIVVPQFRKHRNRNINFFLHLYGPSTRTKTSSSFQTNASIGRFSGALHGSSAQRPRRRGRKADIDSGDISREEKSSLERPDSSSKTCEENDAKSRNQSIDDLADHDSFHNFDKDGIKSWKCNGKQGEDVTGSADKSHQCQVIDDKLSVTSDRDANLNGSSGSSEEVHSVEAAEFGNILHSVVDSVNEAVEKVSELFPASKKEHEEEKLLTKVVDQDSEEIVEQVGQAAEKVTQTAEKMVEQAANTIVEPITTTVSQIANMISVEQYDESDDEFEAYRSLDIPEFKGHKGLNNFAVLQDDEGILPIIYDLYIFMLKRSLFEFIMGMFAAPILLSAVFTILYLPQFSGLVMDGAARDFVHHSAMSSDIGREGLDISLQTVFQVFMFSVSLSTGLQPELVPLSPYTLVVANLNALIAQLIFVFFSGAVFARLSQPSQTVKCSTVALICPPPTSHRLRKDNYHKSLLARYVLVGPQPCELVDVKVDLTYKYNTITPSGTYFRTSQTLHLVRSEIAFLNHGMLVRHIIDDKSPLYQRTHEMLKKEDAVFSLSVVGLERSSMQSVFHVQHYCVYDGDVIWDAEFEDMILVSRKNKRVVDHSLLSKWRSTNRS